MASNPNAKKIACHLNFVHNDEIWRDHVRHEFMSQLRKWPERWGFLVDEYKDMNERLTRGGSPAPSGSRLSRKSISPELRHMSGKSRIYSGRGKASKDNGIHLPPITKTQKPTMPQASVGQYPVTTAKEIGWKSSRADCQLDIYGRYGPKSRPLQGLLKPLNWPQEASP